MKLSTRIWEHRENVFCLVGVFYLGDGWLPMSVYLRFPFGFNLFQSIRHVQVVEFRFELVGNIKNRGLLRVGGTTSNYGPHNVPPTRPVNQKNHCSQSMGQGFVSRHNKVNLRTKIFCKCKTFKHVCKPGSFAYSVLSIRYCWHR